MIAPPRIVLTLLAAALVALWVPAVALAHEVRPAYLEVKQVDAERYDVLFKVPAAGDDLRLGLYLRMPEGTTVVGTVRSEFVGRSHVENTQVSRPGGLEGSEIYVEGLSVTMTDVLVRIERLDGESQVVRLAPDSPSFVVAGPRRNPAGVRSRGPIPCSASSTFCSASTTCSSCSR